MDRSFVRTSKTFSDSIHERIHAGMRDARLVIVTHEHYDHVAGVLHSPYLETIQSHTLLLRARVRTLVELPSRPDLRIDSVTASRYLQFDYDRMLPLAHGVVMLKALGHTPGSQMVFVRRPRPPKHVQLRRQLFSVGLLEWRHRADLTVRA